jgi:hypothetical protein
VEPGQCLIRVSIPARLVHASVTGKPALPSRFLVKKQKNQALLSSWCPAVQQTGNTRQFRLATLGIEVQVPDNCCFDESTLTSSSKRGLDDGGSPIPALNSRLSPAVRVFDGGSGCCLPAPLWRWRWQSGGDGLLDDRVVAPPSPRPRNRNALSLLLSYCWLWRSPSSQFSLSLSTSHSHNAIVVADADVVVSHGE